MIIERIKDYSHFAIPFFARSSSDTTVSIDAFMQEMCSLPPVGTLDNLFVWVLYYYVLLNAEIYFPFGNTEQHITGGKQHV